MTLQADEAHLIHESEVQTWLRAFHSDPVLAVAHIPETILRFLHRHGFLTSENTLTETGLDLCNG